MTLKDNHYYWKISLDHPEPVVDDYYIKDEVIVTDPDLIQKVERLRDLIISYCVLVEKDEKLANKILNEIYQIITSTDNIQYTEFIAYWKVLDISYSIFKKLSAKRNILKNILEKYCKKRRKLYDRLGYSNVTIQALYDSGASRKKGNAAIEKIKNIIQNIFGNIPKAKSVEDIKKLKLTYLLPDSGDNKLFLEFLKEFHLKSSYSQNNQNKLPDFMFKCNNHILIIEAKHLKEPGGEQNKSMSELIDFIKQSEDNPYIHYVSFIDGIYFNLLINPPKTRNNKKGKIYQQKIDIEKALNNYKNNFFVNTAGLQTLLQDLAKECNSKI